MSNEIRDVLADIEAELRVLLNEAPYLSGREAGLASAVNVVRAHREALPAAPDPNPGVYGLSLVVDSRLPEGYAALVSAQAPCSSERATAGTLSEPFWYDGAWSDAMSEAGLRLEEALRDAEGSPEEPGLRYALGILRSMQEDR